LACWLRRRDRLIQISRIIGAYRIAAVRSYRFGFDEDCRRTETAPGGDCLILAHNKGERALRSAITGDLYQNLQQHATILDTSKALLGC